MNYQDILSAGFGKHVGLRKKRPGIMKLVAPLFHEDGGNLFIDVPAAELYPAVLYFGQTVAKVCNMGLYRCEAIANLFYETVDEFVMSGMQRFHPKQTMLPLPGREELEVDYAFETGRVPAYLFAAKEKRIPPSCA